MSTSEKVETEVFTVLTRPEGKFWFATDMVMLNARPDIDVLHESVRPPYPFPENCTTLVVSGEYNQDEIAEILGQTFEFELETIHGRENLHVAIPD